MGIRESRTERPSFELPQSRFLASFSDEGVCWRNGVVEFIKSQTPSTKYRVSGFSVQVSALDSSFLKPDT